MMNEITNRFEQLIESRSWKIAKQELATLEPFQIAEIIGALSKPDRILLFRLLSRESAKETFKHLSYDEQEEIIEGLAANVDNVIGLLNDLDPDDRTAFFEELPGKVSQRLVQMLSAEEREIATRLLGYPKDSIGRLMTPEYVAVKPYYTVAQALEHIRRFGRDSETLNVIYVVDDSWKLVDDIHIREILLASPDQIIADLIDSRFIALNAYDDQEVAGELFRNLDRVALPVTDSAGTLLGIVTIDDVMDVVQEENTEDFQKFGGTEGDLLYEDVAGRTGEKAGRLARDPVPERNADRFGDGAFRRRNFESGSARAVRSADHLERGQLRFPGGESHHPRAGPRGTEDA